MGAVFEFRAGGRWYERGEDGSTCDWGARARVEAPKPAGVVMGNFADWQHDAQLESEVEALFLPEGPGRTRVQLEHRHLDRYGPRRDEMRGIFNSEQGWTSLLAAFAAHAVREAKP